MSTVRNIIIEESGGELLSWPWNSWSKVDMIFLVEEIRDLGNNYDLVVGTYGSGKINQDEWEVEVWGTNHSRLYHWSLRKGSQLVTYHLIVTVMCQFVLSPASDMHKLHTEEKWCVDVLRYWMNSLMENKKMWARSSSKKFFRIFY